MFFKSIDDANRLRSQVSECFERAALPQTIKEVRLVLVDGIITGCCALQHSTMCFVHCVFSSLCVFHHVYPGAAEVAVFCCGGWRPHWCRGCC